MRSNWADTGEVRRTPNVSSCAASSVLPQHDHRLPLMPLVVRFTSRSRETRWSPARDGARPQKSAKVSGGRRRLRGDAFVLEQGLQLARLEHFADDVAAVDEFALDVKLRDGRPVGIGLDALTQLVVLEHVETPIGHAEIIENLHDLAGAASHRKLRRALREPQRLVSRDLV